MKYYETIIPFDAQAKVENQNLAEAVLEKMAIRGNRKAQIVREDSIVIDRGFLSTKIKHNMRIIFQGTDKEEILKSFPPINDTAGIKGRPVDYFVYLLRAALKPLRHSAVLSLDANPDEKPYVISKYLDEILKDYTTRPSIEAVNNPNLYITLLCKDQNEFRHFGTLGYQCRQFSIRLHGPIELVLAVRASVLDQNLRDNKFDKTNQKFTKYNLETHLDYELIKHEEQSNK